MMEGLTKMMDIYRRQNPKDPFLFGKIFLLLHPNMIPERIKSKGFHLTSIVQFSSIDYFICNNMFHYSVAIHPTH